MTSAHKLREDGRKRAKRRHTSSRAFSAPLALRAAVFGFMSHTIMTGCKKGGIDSWNNRITVATVCYGTHTLTKNILVLSATPYCFFMLSYYLHKIPAATVTVNGLEQTLELHPSDMLNRNWDQILSKSKNNLEVGTREVYFIKTKTKGSRIQVSGLQNTDSCKIQTEEVKQNTTIKVLKVQSFRSFFILIVSVSSSCLT